MNPSRNDVAFAFIFKSIQMKPKGLESGRQSFNSMRTSNGSKISTSSPRWMVTTAIRLPCSSNLYFLLTRYPRTSTTIQWHFSDPDIKCYVRSLSNQAIILCDSQSYYRPQTKLRDPVMFLQVSVILFMGGVVSQHTLQVVSQHALQVSRGVYPSMPCMVSRPIPKGELDPPPPGWQLLLWVVRILLECILVYISVWWSVSVRPTYGTNVTVWWLCSVMLPVLRHISFWWLCSAAFFQVFTFPCSNYALPGMFPVLTSLYYALSSVRPTSGTYVSVWWLHLCRTRFRYCRNRFLWIHILTADCATVMARCCSSNLRDNCSIW